MLMVINENMEYLISMLHNDHQKCGKEIMLRKNIQHAKLKSFSITQSEDFSKCHYFD